MDTVTPVQPGSPCIFVDSHGRAHDALVTSVHGAFIEGGTWTEEDVLREHSRYIDTIEDEAKRAEVIAQWVGRPASVPSINLVYVSDDGTKTDPYGRQIERSTSVVHKSNQSAHGMYWRNA